MKNLSVCDLHTLMELNMKIKNEFIEAFNSQKLIPLEGGGNRYRYGIELFTLEAKDFDKAIDLLKVFNKKAGVKEFELLKSEFISGNNQEDRLYQPDKFVKHLKEVLTKRMSSVESRIAEKKVDEVWKFDDANTVEEAYRNVSSKFNSIINCEVEHRNHIQYMERVLKLKLEFIQDVKSLLKEEIEENDSSLETLTINDWKDVSHIVECFNNQLSDLQMEQHRLR